MKGGRILELDYMDIGRRICQHRKALGYTQQKLAEMSNQEPSNISHIERGATKSQYDILQIHPFVQEFHKFIVFNS